MKKLLIITLLWIASACATTEKYNAELNGWIGKKEVALLETWGKPSSIFKLGQQEQIVTYVHQDNEIIPAESMMYTPDFNNGYTLYAPFSYAEDFADWPPAFVVKNICQTSFHIKNGIIQSWQWRGNACQAD